MQFSYARALHSFATLNVKIYSGEINSDSFRFGQHAMKLFIVFTTVGVRFTSF